MPQFGTKSLLLVFAAAALWLSTFRGYPAAEDVRRSVMLVNLLTALFGAVYYPERRRAFWSGFFIVMLISGLGWSIRQNFDYFPLGGSNVAYLLVTPGPGNGHLFEAVFDTVREAFNLLLAMIVGSIAAAIYDQSHPTRSPKNR